MKNFIVLMAALIITSNLTAQTNFEGTIIRQNDVSGGNNYWARLNNLVRGSSDDYIAIRGNKLILYRSADGLINYIDADAGKIYYICSAIKMGYVIENIEGFLAGKHQLRDIYGSDYKATDEQKDILGISCQKYDKMQQEAIKNDLGDRWIATNMNLPDFLLDIYKNLYNTDGFIIESTSNGIQETFSIHVFVKEVDRNIPSDKIMTIPSDIEFTTQKKYTSAYQKHLKSINKQRKEDDLIHVELKVSDDVWDF